MALGPRPSARVEGGSPYVRRSPAFCAPQGPPGWLSRNGFVGTIVVANRERTQLRIAVFKVI